MRPTADETALAKQAAAEDWAARYFLEALWGG